MDVFVERCAGIDIGKGEVVACVRTPGPGGRGRRRQIPHVRRRVGGDGRLVLDRGSHRDRDGGHGAVLGNRSGRSSKSGRSSSCCWSTPSRYRILPGRKSDVLGAEWPAELLEHGLLRGSFVPPPAIRELRDLTRYRKRLTQEHTAGAQRM